MCAGAHSTHRPEQPARWAAMGSHAQRACRQVAVAPAEEQVGVAASSPLFVQSQWLPLATLTFTGRLLVGPTEIPSSPESFRPSTRRRRPRSRSCARVPPRSPGRVAGDPPPAPASDSTARPSGLAVAELPRPRCIGSQRSMSLTASSMIGRSTARSSWRVASTSIPVLEPDTLSAGEAWSAQTGHDVWSRFGQRGVARGRGANGKVTARSRSGTKFVTPAR